MRALALAHAIRLLNWSNHLVKRLLCSVNTAYDMNWECVEKRPHSIVRRNTTSRSSFIAQTGASLSCHLIAKNVKWPSGHYNKIIHTLIMCQIIRHIRRKRCRIIFTKCRIIFSKITLQECITKVETISSKNCLHFLVTNISLIISSYFHRHL